MVHIRKGNLTIVEATFSYIATEVTSSNSIPYVLIGGYLYKSDTLDSSVVP